MKKYLSLVAIAALLVSFSYANASAVKVAINNKTTTANVDLLDFQSIQIMYSPSKQQVYLHNSSLFLSYQLQYTIFGNTASFPSVSYTAVPDGTVGSTSIILKPNANYYITLNDSGEYDSQLNVSALNDKIIWQDLTIVDSDNTISFGCNINNQHITKDVNRILMQCDDVSLITK